MFKKCHAHTSFNTTLNKRSMQVMPHRIYGVPTLQLQPTAQALTKNRCNRHCSCRCSTSSPVARHSHDQPQLEPLASPPGSHTVPRDPPGSPGPLQAGSHFPLGQGFPQTAEDLCRELVPAKIQFRHLGSPSLEQHVPRACFCARLGIPIFWYVFDVFWGGVGR